MIRRTPRVSLSLSGCTTAPECEFSLTFSLYNTATIFLKFYIATNNICKSVRFYIIHKHWKRKGRWMWIWSHRMHMATSMNRFHSLCSANPCPNLRFLYFYISIYLYFFLINLVRCHPFCCCFCWIFNLFDGLISSGSGFILYQY